MSAGTGDAGGPNPRSMTRPKTWSEEVEEAYRFQLAGYRDEIEYKSVNGQEVRHSYSAFWVTCL